MRNDLITKWLTHKFEDVLCDPLKRNKYFLNYYIVIVISGNVINIFFKKRFEKHALTHLCFCCVFNQQYVYSIASWYS